MLIKQKGAISLVKPEQYALSWTFDKLVDTFSWFRQLIRQISYANACRSAKTAQTQRQCGALTSTTDQGVYYACWHVDTYHAITSWSVKVKQQHHCSKAARGIKLATIPDQRRAASTKRNHATNRAIHAATKQTPTHVRRGRNQYFGFAALQTLCRQSYWCD